MDGKQQGSVGCDDGQERGVSEVEGKTRFRPCRGPERSRDTPCFDCAIRRVIIILYGWAYTTIIFPSVLYQIRKTPHTHATVDHTVHAPCVACSISLARHVKPSRLSYPAISPRTTPIHNPNRPNPTSAERRLSRVYEAPPPAVRQKQLKIRIFVFSPGGIGA